MKILVIGDIMLDVYRIGKVRRISPEAPVPVVNTHYCYEALGGAANVALNIGEIIGFENVVLVGDIGNDKDGDIIFNKLTKEYKMLCSFTNQHFTTVKERVIVDGQQLIRIDEELTNPIRYQNFQTLCIPNNRVLSGEAPNFEDSLADFDFIVVADYAKGVVTTQLMEALSGYGNKLIIDPKPENNDIYCRHLLSTPNEKEFRSMRSVNAHYALVTRGKRGAIFMDNEANTSFVIEGEEVVDCEVIGAGDTITAVMTVALGHGLGWINAAKVADACARYVVTKRGTAIVPKEIYNENFKTFIGS